MPCSIAWKTRCASCARALARACCSRLKASRPLLRRILPTCRRPAVHRSHSGCALVNGQLRYTCEWSSAPCALRFGKRRGFMHIIVLGGAGAMGRITVRTLVEYPDVDHITIADYQGERARELAATLGSSRVEARQIDVTDEERLCSLLRGADVALVAVDYVYNLPILRACIKERVHYADLGGLFHMSRTLMELNAEAEAAGITAVMGMGGTPGITNMLARLAVDELERVESIKVQLGCADATPSSAPLVAPYSLRTILDEFTKEPQVFQDGQWYPQQPLSGQRRSSFPCRSDGPRPSTRCTPSARPSRSRSARRASGMSPLRSLFPQTL